VLFSEKPGQLTELAREAAKTFDLLIVVGGDGTLNEVVNGIADLDAEIAVLPAGTGQDFGRTYEIPRRFDDAVRVALHGTPRRVDLGHVVFRSRSGDDAEQDVEARKTEVAVHEEHVASGPPQGHGEVHGEVALAHPSLGADDGDGRGAPVAAAASRR